MISTASWSTEEGGTGKTLIAHEKGCRKARNKEDRGHFPQVHLMMEALTALPDRGTEGECMARREAGGMAFLLFWLSWTQ